jgi:hypothetical protein
MATGAICLAVAGAIRATLPGNEVTLAWTHSVEKTRWEERYISEGDSLNLVEARVQGLGAGMEPPADAVFRDGWWRWAPNLRLRELRLTYSTFTLDYTLCAQGHCQSLRALLGDAPDQGALVQVRPC